MRTNRNHLITLGDSLTGSYSSDPRNGLSHNWTDLLQTHRADHLHLHNLARPGSTSADLLAQGQHTAAAQLLRRGTAQYATLTIGANDLLHFLSRVNLASPATLNPGAYVSSLVENMETAVSALTTAGGKVVIANVPNIADTPFVRPLVRAFPPTAWLLTSLLDQVNSRIAALARTRGLPLIDLRSLHALSGGPLLLGGVNVQTLLHSADGFHPSAVGSGLLANAKLGALHSAFGIDVPPFSDAELLRLAGLSPIDSSASFDVSRFVIPPRRPVDEAA